MAPPGHSQPWCLRGWAAPRGAQGFPPRPVGWNPRQPPEQVTKKQQMRENRHSQHTRHAHSCTEAAAGSPGTRAALGRAEGRTIRLPRCVVTVCCAGQKTVMSPGTRFPSPPAKFGSARNHASDPVCFPDRGQPLHGRCSALGGSDPRTPLMETRAFRLGRCQGAREHVECVRRVGVGLQAASSHPKPPRGGGVSEDSLSEKEARDTTPGTFGNLVFWFRTTPSNF